MKRTTKSKKNSKLKSAKRTTHKKVEEAKSWSSSFSQHLISDYAIPLTRLVEAKLVSLQYKVQ